MIHRWDILLPGDLLAYCPGNSPHPSVEDPLWNMVEGDQEPADPRSGTSKDSGIHNLIEVTLW